MKARKIHEAFHTSLIQPYYEDKFRRYIKPLPQVQVKDRSVGNEAEALPSKKTNPGKVLYFVKWKGFPDHENT